MHRCECVVISLCQCIQICIYMVNKVNLNLLCGQEVWSEPSTGARMVPANGQTTKTKKNLLYVVLVGKPFHLITNIYIHVQFLFSKRGCASIG